MSLARVRDAWVLECLLVTGWELELPDSVLHSPLDPLEGVSLKPSIPPPGKGGHHLLPSCCVGLARPRRHFSALLVGRRQKRAVGSRAFTGFWLSICSPDFAILISPCLGKTGGRRCWVRWGGPRDISFLARLCVCGKMVAPGALSGGQFCRAGASCAEGTRPMSSASAVRLHYENPSLSACTSLPCTNLWSLEQATRAWLVGGSQSCLWKRRFPHFSLPPSLPPAFSRCHFSLD